MKATQQVKRRQFLRSAVGAVGAIGFVSDYGSATSSAAEKSPKGPVDQAALQNLMEEMDYFNKLFPKKLPPGGIVAVHNAIRLREPMKEFLEMMAKHPDFDSVILSLTMDDGFSVNYRHRQ